jgi:hypothetical protein
MTANNTKWLPVDFSLDSFFANIRAQALAELLPIIALTGGGEH